MSFIIVTSTLHHLVLSYNLHSRFQKDPAFHTRFLEDWTTCGPTNLLGKEEDEILQEDVDRLDALR